MNVRKPARRRREIRKYGNFCYIHPLYKKKPFLPKDRKGCFIEVGTNLLGHYFKFQLG